MWQGLTRHLAALRSQKLPLLDLKMPEKYMQTFYASDQFPNDLLSVHLYSLITISTVHYKVNNFSITIPINRQTGR